MRVPFPAANTATASINGASGLGGI